MSQLSVPEVTDTDSRFLIGKLRRGRMRFHYQLILLIYKHNVITYISNGT